MTMPQGQNGLSEQLLWSRAIRGLVLGVILFTVAGFTLMGLGYPAMSLAGRAGVSLFIGFWSGPFFGSVIGVAYHQAKSEHAEAAPALPAAKSLVQGAVALRIGPPAVVA